MTTVYTKAELETAIRNRETRIIVKGKLADEFKKKKRRKTAAVLGAAALTMGSLIALPFTGGASSVGIAAGAMGLTVGTVTISTAELAILVGGTVATIAVLRGAKVTFNADGSVTVEPQYR